MFTTAFSFGEFCWTDLGTTNTTEAKAFYSALFGWTTANNTPNYSMFQKAGKETSAFFTQKAGTPAYWYAYVTVANVDEVAAKAVEYKGKVLSAPAEVLGENNKVLGRVCFIQDPTGAICAAWEPKAHHGASVWNEYGASCWFELSTNNVDVAGGFWAKLFGWTAKPSEIPGMNYTQFFKGDKAVGGMTATANATVKPYWLSYFAVENCDATCAKAKTLGATVVQPAHNIPTVGRFAVFADPQGATFAVLQPFTAATATN